MVSFIGSELLVCVVLERVQFWPVRVESGYQLKIRARYETSTGNTALIRSVLTAHCVFFHYKYYTAIRIVNA